MTETLALSEALLDSEADKPRNTTALLLNPTPPRSLHLPISVEISPALSRLRRTVPRLVISERSNAFRSDLKSCVRLGAFRADLYYRLSVFDLMLPPLRTRKEDLEELVPVLLAEYNTRTGKQVNVVPPDVWQQLYDYHWPGNVRELRNVIERCVLLSDDNVLPSQWLQLDLDGTTLAASAPMLGINCIHLPLDGSMALDEMDRHIIKTALERHRYNILATARALGTTRETLRYRVQKYGLNELLRAASG